MTFDDAAFIMAIVGTITAVGVVVIGPKRFSDRMITVTSAIIATGFACTLHFLRFVVP